MIYGNSSVFIVYLLANWNVQVIFVEYRSIRSQAER